MSASNLHHIHGINGVKYKSTQFIDGSSIIHAVLDQSQETCPSCKSSRLHFNETHIRRLQMCPTGSKPCWLYLALKKESVRIASINGGHDPHLFLIKDVWYVHLKDMSYVSPHE